MTLEEFKETLKTTKDNMARMYANEALPDNFRQYCFGVKSAMEITLELAEQIDGDDGK